MSLTSRKIETFRLTLDRDRDKPVDDRAFFEFRFLSERDLKEIADKAASLPGGADGQIEGLPYNRFRASMDFVFYCLRITLVGWGNLFDVDTGAAVAFDPAVLENILRIADAVELLRKFYAEQRQSPGVPGFN